MLVAYLKNKSHIIQNTDHKNNCANPLVGNKIIVVFDIILLTLCMLNCW